MATDELTQSELMKRFGERVELLARMHAEAARVLAERIAAFRAVQERVLAEFSRASTLTERLAERLAARIQARMAKG